MQFAAVEHGELMAEIIGRRDLERNFQFFEAGRHDFGQEGLEDTLDIELAEAQAAFNRLGESAGARPPHAAGHLGTGAEDGTCIVVNVAAAHAGGNACAHQRADGGTGDRDRFDTEFVQRLYDMDMRKATCAATAERDGEGRAQPLPPVASAGPTTRIAGSTDSSFLATAFTSSSVTPLI